MATVQATLLNRGFDAALFTPETLALISSRLTVEHSVLDKVVVTTALHAKWDMKFNNVQYPLDSIKLEFGYPDSQNIISYRNSATILGATIPNVMVPLIWSESNQQQTFQSEFLQGTPDNVTVRYKVLFKISPSLVGFNDTFITTKELHISTEAHDFTLKVFLQ